MKTKRCTACGKLKPIDKFRGRSDQIQDKIIYASKCRVCECAATKEWYDKRKIDSEWMLTARLRKHGLTPNQYYEMLNAQDGKCAICLESMEKPLVDHDHECCSSSTGKYSCGRCVRGILCQRCNLLLGYANDNIEHLERAIKYLSNSLVT